MAACRVVVDSLLLLHAPLCARGAITTNENVVFQLI